MSRNNDITKQFLAKQLWRYRTAKPKEIVARLLEFECIRRNFAKGTLFNMAVAIRAYAKETNSKHANKLICGVYKETIEELKRNDSNLDKILSVGAAEGICEPEEYVPAIDVEEPKEQQVKGKSIDERIEELERYIADIRKVTLQLTEDLTKQISQLEYERAAINTIALEKIEKMEEEKKELIRTKSWTRINDEIDKLYK